MDPALASAVVQAAPGPLLVLDARDRIIAWNPAARRFLGESFGLPELTDGEREAVELLHADGSTWVPEDSPFRDVRRGGSTLHGAILLARRRTSAPVPVLVSAAPLDAAGTEEGRVICSLQAQTPELASHLRTEQRLRRERDLRGAVIDELPGIYILLDERGYLLRWNRNLQEITGYTEDELRGRNAVTLWPEREHERIKENTREVHRSGASTIESYLLTRDGREIPYLLTGVCREIQGIRLVMSFGTDISQRKQWEHQLALASQVFRQIQDAVLIVDTHWRVEAANDAYTRLTGLTAENHGPLEGIFSVSSLDQVSALEDAWAALKQNRLWEGEVDVLDANGRAVGQWLTVVALDEGDAAGSYILVFHDITELRESRARLHEQAYFDALTGLANRTRFQEVVGQAMHRALRGETLVAVVILDLQRFRDINSSLGPERGDAVLRQIAERARSSVRGTDTVARIGPNQFALCVEQLHTQQDAYLQARRVVEDVTQPIELGDQSLDCSVAVGIAVHPGESETPDDLLRYADTAMHEAKAWGRDTIFFYSEELTRRAVQRLELAQALREGLQKHWFRLHYQIQVEVATQRVVGVESLARFEHPDSGAVSPGEFIPVAEEAGLIQELGRWILRGACRNARAWLDEGYDFGRVAVNVSALQLQNEDFPTTVAAALTDSGLPAHHLELEITESALVDASGGAILETLHALRQLGVRVLIDDFGTGYSSLVYLRRLPIDGLKIDKGFIQELTESVEARRIVDTIVTLASHLGLDVVAEGVETERHREYLASYQAIVGQGFLWSRPAPENQLLELLRRP